ncbi:MAG: cysteine--tRNA ligase, partial [Planctomycetota bacterium]
MRLYNSLTHSLEDFAPIDPPRVTMYSCGPTVYDFAHIGNFRSFLFADVLRRVLEVLGHDVHHVMNLTDVGHMTDDDVADGAGEDKMAAAAKRLKENKKSGADAAGQVANPDDPYQIAAFYADAFIEDAKALGLKVASDGPGHMPRATDNVDKMLEQIQALVEKDHAYVGGDGAVYFDVQSFPGYGKLSGNSIDNLRGGAGGRVSEDETAAKRHPADFLLWKPDASHIMKWDSAYGEGYPGWHIECSAMAIRHLGQDVIDLHTGGEDNIFPHHECEIAQSCCVTGEESFARFWLHCRHLKVEGEKMSKSKGNFYTVRDVLAGKAGTSNEVAPAVLRYELVKTHYRAGSNFTAQGLKDSGSAVTKLQKLHDAAIAAGATADDVGNDHAVVARFLSYLSDDLNMSGALAAVFEWINTTPAADGEALGVLAKIDAVLGVLDAGGTDLGDDVAALAQAIDDARAAKDFAKSDALRKDLLDRPAARPLTNYLTYANHVKGASMLNTPPVFSVYAM